MTVAAAVPMVAAAVSVRVQTCADHNQEQAARSPHGGTYTVQLAAGTPDSCTYCYYVGSEIRTWVLRLHAGNIVFMHTLLARVLDRQARGLYSKELAVAKKQAWQVCLTRLMPKQSTRICMLDHMRDCNVHACGSEACKHLIGVSFQAIMPSQRMAQGMAYLALSKVGVTLEYDLVEH